MSSSTATAPRAVYKRQALDRPGDAGHGRLGAFCLEGARQCGGSVDRTDQRQCRARRQRRRGLCIRDRRWTGQVTPGTGGFGRFALKARANVVGPSIALTNVNVELDGNVAEGVMTYANNGRQTLQATLAAGNLDFTPYISTFRLLASGARDWNRQVFDLNALSTTDLDMRLSAARVTIGASKLGRTAFGANLRGGALALSVAEAQIYGGVARGS